MNPSSDIQISDVTLAITALHIASVAPCSRWARRRTRPGTWTHLQVEVPRLTPCPSGRGPCLDPGHEPVQELVPAFGEPAFDVAGGDPLLREREERPSIQPLKADLQQRFDVRSIRPLGVRRVDEAVWPLHGVEDIPLDIGRRGWAKPDDPLAADTEIALGLHDPVGPPALIARCASGSVYAWNTTSGGASNHRWRRMSGLTRVAPSESRRSGRARRAAVPTCETSRSIAELRRGVLGRACTPGPCPPSRSSAVASPRGCARVPGPWEGRSRRVVPAR